MKIELDILPPHATAQSGKRLGVINGRARMFKTKEAISQENMFHSLLYSHKPQQAMKGAISIEYYFFYPYLKGVKKRLIGKIFPKTTKPDYDNLTKVIQDVMTKLQFWTDDSVIYTGRCFKAYAPQGKIIIKIKEIDPETDLTTILKLKGIINEQGNVGTN